MAELEYSDMISVNHGIYDHFGIFVDKNHVIHYSGKDEDFFT
ncbi:lecithin retinol acyltransferase family protein [Terrisporobacter sp.]